jgi:UDP-N-acetylglucosamine 4,6-dehydratase/5-epimerase
MNNKKILIIGGSGALGKTLMKYYHENNELIVMSRDEHKHVALMKTYKNVKFQIGDIKDKESIMRTISEHRPDIIINAAALKHVPVCEINAFESVKTNIIGHQNLIDCVNLSNHQIETLIFISTDKACKPINIYGMCKAIAERLYVNFAEKQTDIKVIITRYGNVLESTGSVIPFFKKLLLAQDFDFLPITHRSMTRFLMTLEDAVKLIEWAYYHADSHGKIIVPKVKSLRIVDVAKELAKSFGSPQVKLKYIGIRPGEKIHEEMISSEESLKCVEYGEYYMITNEIINQNPWAYSSGDNVLEKESVGKFLKDKGVL